LPNPAKYTDWDRVNLPKISGPKWPPAANQSPPSNDQKSQLKLRWAWAQKLNPAEIGVGLMLALALFSFVDYGWSVLTFPYPVDYGEGPLLDQAVRLARFENIYRPDISRPPYTIANYPPLYLLLQVPLVWLFGPAYGYGRLISWLAMLAAALFVGLILKTLTQDRRAALIGGLTLLAVPYVAFWAPQARIDALALALSLGALYLLVRFAGRPWALLGGAALLVAAIYTRQSYGLAAPLAAFFWLLSRPPRSQAVILAAGVAAPGAGLFLLLNLTTGGGFFFNIVTANINQFNWQLLATSLESLWRLMPGLLVISALFLLAGIWFRPGGWPLIGPYLIGASLSALTIGKLGSNVNYFLELSAAASLAMGACLAWQRRRPWRYTGLALVLVWQIFLFLPGLPHHRAIELKLRSRAELDQLMAYVRQADGPVLADEYMGLLPLAGRPIYIQPFEATQLANSGLWDQSPFLEAIERQEFSLVLIFRVGGSGFERARWTPEMLEAIDTHYKKVNEVGEVMTVTVYQPR
jgi:hypothetical protein